MNLYLSFLFFAWVYCASKQVGDNLIKIKFSKIKHEENLPKYGIVFSWHGLSVDPSSKLYDQRFGETKTISTGNLFKVAVKSCHDAHPELPIYLMTNAEYIDRETMSLLKRAYKVDLMKESGLNELFEKTGDPKFGFGTKAYSVIYGWDKGVIPDQVIFFDIDITIIEVTERWNLHSMLEPLKFYDIAGVMEGYTTSLIPERFKHTLAVGDGWEMNTGAWAVKKSTKPLLEKWVAKFKESPERFAEFQSGEQQAFMLALQESPEFRLFALPPIFNFRRATLHARNGPQLPVMMHTHTFSYEGFNTSNYKDIAKHAASLLFEDCYNRMKLISGPYHFICDMLVM